MIKNIVFDWSGTISDDFEVVFHTLRAIFSELGVAPITFSHFQEVVDIPFESYLKRLFSDSPDILGRFSDKRLVHELFERYFRLFGPPKVIEGVEPALNELKGKGYRMAVFSTHHQGFVEEESKLFFSGVNYFERIFGSAGNKFDSVGRLLSGTGFVPSETLFVGDTTHDILVGRHAGMGTAAVLSGYHLREQLASARPDFILGSVAGLPRLLQV